MSYFSFLLLHKTFDGEYFTVLWKKKQNIFPRMTFWPKSYSYRPNVYILIRFICKLFGMSDSIGIELETLTHSDRETKIELEREGEGSKSKSKVVVISFQWIKIHQEIIVYKRKYHGVECFSSLLFSCVALKSYHWCLLYASNQKLINHLKTINNNILMSLKFQAFNYVCLTIAFRDWIVMRMCICLCLCLCVCVTII